MNRQEAINEIYRTLRVDEAANRVWALLYTLDIEMDEIEVAAQIHGDLK